jgi:NAD+ kinase
MLAAAGTPIIPVHLGTVGFLAGVEINQWLSVYEQWLGRKALLSLRCMLEFSVDRGGQAVYNNTCLNDIVVASQGIAKLIRLRVKTEVAPNEYADLGYYRSDGLIIATPTGSTAYSMAAGGPILDPEIEAQIISPICSFALSNRPLVLPSRQPLLVTVEKDQRSGVLLTVDGQDTFRLEPCDRIIIRHSPHYAQLITADRSAYYSALKNKLAWGSQSEFGEGGGA